MSTYFSGDGEVYRIGATYTCDECGQEIDESEVHQDKWTFCPDCWREQQGEEEEEEPPAQNVNGSNPFCPITPHHTGLFHRLDATGVKTLCGKTIFAYDYRVVEEAAPSQWCAGCYLAERAATK